MAAAYAMALSLIAHGAKPFNALMPSGNMRSLAGRLGQTAYEQTAMAQPPRADGLTAGRVTSAGTWKNAPVHAALAGALGRDMAAALRPEFEWYFARGAFFHNDAHYENVLFGIWCVAGPRAELVFPRLCVRLDASPGAIAVFDPFEVHGVLAAGRLTYSAQDYADAEPSVFVGFELELTALVRKRFDVPSAVEAPVLSSRTRIDAETGAFV